MFSVRARRGIVVVSLAVAALATVFQPVAEDAQASEPPYRQIHFPVGAKTNFTNDWGAPRSGGRTHQGNDLFAPKMSHLVSTVHGRVSLRLDAGGLSGHMITIRDDEGWSYLYMHVNNDNPGTDDGAAPPHFVFAPGIVNGQRVVPGQHVGFLGDSGNAEGTSPHLHFEIRTPGNVPVNPWPSLRLAQGLPAGTRCAYDTNPKAASSIASAKGYWALAADGGVFSFGAAAWHGSTGDLRLTRPIVGMAATPTSNGYWLVAGDGGVFSFGDAGYFGSTGAMKLNQPIVGIAATPTGKGYWLVASDGGIFNFGDAAFYGSTGAIRLNQPIVAIASSTSGKGYSLMASDGGIFSFGDAKYFGSVPGAGIRVRTVGLATTATGNGYWVVAADGGVFSFGDAGYYGSLPGTGYCQHPGAVDLVRSATGKGYWIMGDDGSMWAYGDARYLGGLNNGAPLNGAPIGLTLAP